LKQDTIDEAFVAPRLHYRRELSALYDAGAGGKTVFFFDLLQNISKVKNKFCFSLAFFAIWVYNNEAKIGLSK